MFIERRDRQGTQIRKGQKQHHITFKDEVKAEGDPGAVDHSEESEGENSNQFSDQKDRNNNRRKLPLHDVIYVESYKEYNASNP